MNNIRVTKSVFILGLLLISIFLLPTHTVSAKDSIYNAKMSFTLSWSDNLIKEPIVPRDKITELELTLTLEIKTGNYFGYGVLEGYKGGNPALIDIRILEYPSWCYATLKSGLFQINVSEKEEASTSLYIYINEDAPAYSVGSVKIEVSSPDLGLIKGNNQTFELSFKPSYLPIIKTAFPKSTTKVISPNSEAVFPIEVENIGNAQTQVFFEIGGVPDGWSAVITNSVIIDEKKGSKKIAYLNVVPPSGFGYYDDEANILVKITPAWADNTSFTGTPLYANFIVQNRGFSSSGIEAVLPLLIIVIIIIFVALFVIRKVRSKKNKTAR